MIIDISIFKLGIMFTSSYYFAQVLKMINNYDRISILDDKKVLFYLYLHVIAGASFGLYLCTLIKNN